METRSPGLVNMTQYRRCSKQLSGVASHGCEQLTSFAELRLGLQKRNCVRLVVHFQLAQLAQHQADTVLQEQDLCSDSD